MKLRAQVNYEKDQFDPAIADYSKAIGLRSDDAALYSARGFARLKKGDKSGALEDFSKAIALQPGESAYYTDRLYIYLSRGDAEKAVGDFTHLIALKPDETDLYLRRADLYLKLNKYEEARADYEKVLANDPNNVAALSGEGEVIAKRGDRRAGAAKLQQALQLASDPKDKERIQVKLREIGVGPIQ